MELLERRVAAAAFDFNGDDVVDIRDVDEICSAKWHFWLDGGIFETSPGSRKYDVNEDGTLDMRDIDFVLAEEFGTTRGDINLDGIVDGADLHEVWKASPGRRQIETMSPNDDSPSFWGAGFYSMGNLTCRFEGVDPINPRDYNVDRAASAEAFVRMQGDYNADGRFDSSDLVGIYASGAAPEVETGELVELFQLGTYES